MALPRSTGIWSAAWAASLAFYASLGLLSRGSCKLRPSCGQHVEKGGDRLMTLTMMPITLDHAIALLRVVVGLLFMGHGAQKLFGWFGGHGQDCALKKPRTARFGALVKKGVN